MDPNETLQTLREALDGDPDENFYSYDVAVEAFQALDSWISHGGFLPEAWKPERRANWETELLK